MQASTFSTTQWCVPTAKVRLSEKDIAQRQSASRYLKELTAIGVLREVQAGKEKLFIHPKLMQLLADDRNAFTPPPHA